MLKSFIQLTELEPWPAQLIWVSANSGVISNAYRFQLTIRRGELRSYSTLGGHKATKLTKVPS